MTNEETETKLNKISEELKYHRKLLESLVETKDSYRFEREKMKKDVTSQIDEIAKKLEGSPFASMLKEVSKTLGGKHGS